MNIDKEIVMNTIGIDTETGREIEKDKEGGIDLEARRDSIERDRALESNISF